MRRIFVTKANGEKEIFDPKKVIYAVLRSGASEKTAQKVLLKLQPQLHNGMSTRELFGKVFKILNKQKPEYAARYDLKNAMMRLGPEGHMFETFVGEVLREMGYDTELRRIIQGKNINHEIDVIARKNGKEIMIECKYHNQPGIKCRVQTVLYVHSRFLDIKKEGFTEAWVVTNTKFSYDAIKYARGVNMGLWGWRYPYHASLEKIIDEHKLFPVTMLKSVGEHEKRMLAHANKTLVKDILSVKNVKGIKNSTLSKMREEAKQLIL